jgi:signal peptidase I
MMRTILTQGSDIKFKAKGQSMVPFVQNGDVLHVTPNKRFRKGDVVLYAADEQRLIAHRITALTSNKDTSSISYLIQGDNCFTPDGYIAAENILGRVTFVERKGIPIKLDSMFARSLGLIWQKLLPFTQIAYFWLNRIMVRLIRRKSMKIMCA